MGLHDDEKNRLEPGVHVCNTELKFSRWKNAVLKFLDNNATQLITLILVDEPRSEHDKHC